MNIDNLNFIIKEPRASDFGAFISLVKANLIHINAFLDWHDFTLGKTPTTVYREYLSIIEARPNHEILFIFVETELVGYILIQKGGFENSVQIVAWGDQRYSHIGLGTKVMGALLYRIFKDRNIHLVELHIDELNTVAQRVAEKNGFTKTDFKYDATYLSYSGSGVLEVWILKRPEIRIHDNLNKTILGRVILANLTGRTF
jgi:RimJ/RimL family protein N-acetyltransferase